MTTYSFRSITDAIPDFMKAGGNWHTMVPGNTVITHDPFNHQITFASGAHAFTIVFGSDTVQIQGTADSALATFSGTELELYATLKAIVNFKKANSVIGTATPSADDVVESATRVFVSPAQKTVVGNTSGTNTGDQTLPVKAAYDELNTGTDDANFATALALEGSKYLTQNGGKISATASGTNTYAATIAPAITAYAAGQRFFITFTNANTGAATINLNSLGEKAIAKNGTTALVSGDIVAGQVILLAYDGTEFQMIGVQDISGIATNTTAISAINTRLQNETQDYLARVVAAGGVVDIATLAALDRFVARGKREAWFSALKQFWCPVGDFAASKIFFINPSGVTPVFYNFVTGDYSQLTGYTLSSNSTKYIDTALVPNSNGITSTNLSLGATSLDDRVYGDNANSRTIGNIPTTTGIEPTLSINFAGTFGLSLAPLDNPFGGECTTLVGHYGSSSFGSVVNGVECMSASLTYSQTLNVPTLIFKSVRLNDVVYFATGSIGFYFIGTDLSQALCILLCNAINDLMVEVGRRPYKRHGLLTFGDSIMAGSSGGNTGRAGRLLANALGLREINISQGSSRAATANANTVAGLIRYSGGANLQVGNIVMVYGTNDMGGDSTTTPTTSIVNAYGSAISTIVAGFKAKGYKIVVGTPPYRDTWSSTVQLAYAAACSSACKTNNVVCVDLYNAFVDTGNTAALMADGTHPNVAGNLVMFEYLLYGHRGQLVRKPTLDFASIAAGTSADLTVTVYNAVAGMSVSLGLPAALETGLVANAFVSANDTVTVRLSNITGSAIDPASAQYKVTVFTNY